MTFCDILDQSKKTELNLPEGVPPLLSFYIYLTSSCNLRCRHCWIDPVFEEAEPKPGTYVDLQALKEAVQQANELGLSGAKLTGGEPLLHPQFREVVSYLSSEGLSLTMETNGTLITPELARFLKEDNKVHFISVSLDSPDPVDHDTFRGIKGSFNKTLNGLDALVRAGYTNCQVIMAVHRGNRHQIADLVKVAIEHGAASVKFNPVHKSGRGTGMDVRGEILNFCEILTLSDHINNEIRPTSKIKVIHRIPMALTPITELMRTKNECGNCGVANILGILGSGEIALCGIGQIIPELIFGKLGVDDIRDIWQNHQTLRKLRSDLEMVADYPGICGSCIHARACHTGCVADNYLNNGLLVSPQRMCEEAERVGLFPESRLKTTPK